ncbi:MAG: hypothetical protein ACC652_13030 [Acidimicrobiales bacterium]
MKDQFAVCERPGGYGENHRRVRRQEEILWIRHQGFSRVVSIIPSPHNLHNYEELDMPYVHRPFAKKDDLRLMLPLILKDLQTLLDNGEKILLHGEEVGDQVAGLLAAYLIYADMVPHQPQAVSVVERILGRKLGPWSHEMVAIAMAQR